MVAVNTDNWIEHRKVEVAFLAGVRTNLQRYATALAGERIGVDGAHLAEVLEDNERQHVLDQAAVCGLAAPMDGAADAEIWAVLRRGRRPVLNVGIKSYVATAALAGAGCPAQTRLIERAVEYVYRARARAEGTPSVFVLFSPRGWPEKWEHLALSELSSHVILCRSAPGAAPGLWVGSQGANVGWFTWLALTPMTMPGRLAYCAEFLGSLRELQVPNHVIRVEDLARRLGLPAELAIRVIRAVCRQTGGRFRLGRVEDVDYVQRVKMR